MATLYTPPGRPMMSIDGAAPVSMRDLSRRIAGRRWLILGVTVAVFAAVTAYTFLATPRYRSAASLRIDTETSGPAAMSAFADQAGSAAGSMGGAVGSFSSGAAGLLGLGRDELQTEIGVLKSDRVADAMIDSLSLGVRLKSPDVPRASLLTARTAEPSVDVDGRIVLTRQSGGSYAVELKKFEDVPNVPKLITPGTPFGVGGFVITLQRALVAKGPDQIVLDILPRYKVYKLLEKRLSIAQQEGGSRLVDVTFDDPDRFLAAQAVNTLIGEYVKYTTSTDRLRDTTTVADLRAQVDSTARKLTAAEGALRSFEESSRLIAPEDQATAQVKRISEISAKVDAISTERNALAKMLDIIQQNSKGGANPTAYRQLATFPTLITNRAIQDLLQSLVELENKRAELGATRTEQDVEYQQYTNRITEIERQLYTEGPQYLQSLDQQLAMTVRTVSALSDTLNRMPAAVMRYGQLLRDRTLLEAIYVGEQKQLKTAELRDALRQDKVKVVDVPRVANIDDPQFPKKPVMLVVGAVLGFAIALTMALFAELWREPTIEIETVAGVPTDGLMR